MLGLSLKPDNLSTSLHMMLQFVSASQPLNALAFIVDGLYYGVSDFRYAAISMVSLIIC